MCRRLAVLLLAAVLLTTTACRMQSSSRTVLTAAGAGVAITGLLVTSQGPVDSDGDNENDVVFNDNLGAYVVGAVLLFAGVGMMVGGAAAQPADEAPAAVPVAAPPRARIVATSPIMFPGLAVDGAVVTSPVTALSLDLAGWSVGQPYIVAGRTHLTAIADATKLEVVLQRLARPASVEDVVARLDVSAYGTVTERPSMIGAVPAVEIAGATADLVPVVITVAVADQQLLSIVCHGTAATCRQTIARSSWNAL